MDVYGESKADKHRLGTCVLSLKQPCDRCGDVQSLGSSMGKLPQYHLFNATNALMFTCLLPKALFSQNFFAMKSPLTATSDPQGIHTLV